MGWSGIWLVALRPGETAEEAAARTTEMWIAETDDDAEHCIAYDPDYGELVDLTLPEGEARWRYNWL